MPISYKCDACGAVSPPGHLYVVNPTPEQGHGPHVRFLTEGPIKWFGRVDKEVDLKGSIDELPKGVHLLYACSTLCRNKLGGAVLEEGDSNELPPKRF